MHWATNYVGLKHAPGGRDRSGIDCWGLLYLVYPEVFQITLPCYPGIAEASVMEITSAIHKAEESEWTEVEVPFEGAAVAMSQSRTLHHVGVFSTGDGGMVIHSLDGHSVIAESIRSLRKKGFRTIKFFRHKLWPLS